LYKKSFTISIILSLFSAFLLASFILADVLGASSPVSKLIFASSMLFSLQGIFTLSWLVFNWESPENYRISACPTRISPPEISFSILIPARHEAGVIEETIRALANMDYPENLMEVLILCRHDDRETIEAVSEIIKQINKSFIKLVVFFREPINKPNALNTGLEQARNNYICVFDAEDQPSLRVLKLVNTKILETKADVIQAGVQLMNFKNPWFSVFNVLEYFFWFRSGLAFFYRFGGFIPLAGNSVFIKTDLLKKIGGWNEERLTEDADISISLAKTKSQFAMIYDENIVTTEETPGTVASFIRQRSRWNQGFLQILLAGAWLDLPDLRSRLLAFYILFSPFTTLMSILYFPLGIILAFYIKEPLLISLFTFLPLYVFLAQILTNLFGLSEFSRKFHSSVRLSHYLKLPVLFLPYQLLISLGTLNCLKNFLSGANLWEKTLHTNAHRYEIAE
jgi:glycosyltransferase XagB